MLAHARTTLIVTIGTVVFTGFLAWVIPKGFFPQEDTGLVIAVTEAPPDVSFTRMMDLQRAVADVVRNEPGVASVASFIGADGTNSTPNTGRLSITLAPHDDRDDSADVIIARLKPKLARITGVSTYLQSVQDLQIDARASRTPYQFTLEDADPAELAEWTPKVIAALRAQPELRDVTSDYQEAGLGITADHRSRHRLAPRDLGAEHRRRPLRRLRSAPGLHHLHAAEPLSRRARSEARHGQDQNSLSQLYVRSSSGVQVPLSTFVHVAEAPAPLAVNHQGQFASATISFDVGRGSSLGDAVEATYGVMARLGAPPGLHGAFQGTAQAFRESLASEPVLVLAALITVYIVLGVLYESTIHPSRSSRRYLLPEWVRCLRSSCAAPTSRSLRSSESCCSSAS